MVSGPWGLAGVGCRVRSPPANGRTRAAAAGGRASAGEAGWASAAGERGGRPWQGRELAAEGSGEARASTRRCGEQGACAGTGGRARAARSASFGTRPRRCGRWPRRGARAARRARRGDYGDGLGTHVRGRQRGEGSFAHPRCRGSPARLDGVRRGGGRGGERRR